MTSTDSSRLSLWSTDSLPSVGSGLSTGSALAWRSRWSLLADRSFGTALTSRGGGRALAGPPAALAAVTPAAHAGHLLERARRRRPVGHRPA